MRDDVAVTELYPWLKDHWSFFVQRLDSGRLAHALLVEGAAGIGKGRLAQDMVRRLLCASDNEHACGACRSCQLFTSGAHPDYFELQIPEGKKVIRVDQVRKLIASLDLTTSISRRKVAFIHPAEAMNSASANALLKSLEEPSGDTVIILLSHNIGSLPVTVRSRCQAIAVKQPEPSVATEWLLNHSGQPAEVVEAAMYAAGGSPLRAQGYLDSPEIEHWTLVGRSLTGLLGRPASVSQVSAQLTELDATDLWRWLSMYCAGMIRQRMAGLPSGGIPDHPGLTAAGLLDLQKSADINRRMSESPVRGDLLLQEWLIKWAEQVV